MESGDLLTPQIPQHCVITIAGRGARPLAPSLVVGNNESLVVATRDFWYTERMSKYMKSEIMRFVVLVILGITLIVLYTTGGFSVEAIFFPFLAVFVIALVYIVEWPYPHPKKNPPSKPEDYTDEKVVKTYKPESFTQNFYYPFSKRTAFIITTKRVVYRGPIHFMDKTIAYRDISEVVVNSEWGGLQIMRKPHLGDDGAITVRMIEVSGRWVPVKGAQELINQQRMKLDKKELI